MDTTEPRMLLLIDDDPSQIRLISGLAGRAGWRTQAVARPEAAIDLLEDTRSQKPHAVILDSWVAGDDSCQLIGQLRAIAPRLPILLLTGSASPLMAVEAMRAGANDYLMKPLASERLLYALECAAEHNEAQDELAPLTEKIENTLDFDMMIGSAPDFRTALARAAKAARGHGQILIAGEAGTGKELLARAIYSASQRAKAPLHVLQCSGVATSHLASALYGHEKGAFAGAFEAKEGALREAEGATLLIDDIERLPPELQDRIADTIATGEVQPMGANHKFRVDVRIIATARGKPEALVAQGVLTERLGEAFTHNAISLPPLRARQDDIGPLARHFLALIGSQPGLRKLSITDEALNLLRGYEWPGNLRQLQAVLFRAVVFCDKDSLTPEDFPQLSDIVGEPVAGVTNGAGGITLFSPDGHLRPLDEIEADVIRLAIGHYRGRMSEVARRLGIGRSTLYRKLGALGIDNAA